MSGICGIVNFDGAPVDPDVLRKMAEAAACLDCDGIHYWIEGNVGFAYVSLHTTLESLRERECEFSRKGNIVLAADARVDNRGELIRTLTAKGYLQDKNPTDTELILTAFECWGEDCHDHLQGAFAVAVWDTNSRRLLLLRDRIGERVLYWHCASKSFFFASEPIQLLACGKVPGGFNLERILAYLLGVQPKPMWSYFRHIQRLPESHLLKTTGNETILKRYWTWESIQPKLWDRSVAAKELAERLRNAVARRIAPRGETGVLLSGGLDSSSVAAEAAAYLKRHGEQLHVLTWMSETGDGIDERPLSSVFVTTCANVVEHPVQADRLWPLSRYPEAYADPNDPEKNAYPDLLLTTIETAQESGVTVLMSGAGGDPVIGWLVPDLALLLRGHFVTLWRRWRRTGLRRSTLIQQLRMATKQYVPNWLSNRGEQLAREAGLDHPPVPWGALISQRNFRLFALCRWGNTSTLERCDRWSRRTGVRLEVPWHDAELVPLILSLPDAAVDLAPPMKSLLREAMVGRLPEKLRIAPTNKNQTSQLRSKGLLQNERRLIERMMSSSYLEDLGLVDGKEMLRSYREMVRQHSVMPKLWEIITLECWLHTHLA